MSLLRPRTTTSGTRGRGSLPHRGRRTAPRCLADGVGSRLARRLKPASRRVLWQREGSPSSTSVATAADTRTMTSNERRPIARYGRSRRGQRGESRTRQAGAVLPPGQRAANSIGSNSADPVCRHVRRRACAARTARARVRDRLRALAPRRARDRSSCQPYEGASKEPMTSRMLLDTQGTLNSATPPVRPRARGAAPCDRARPHTPSGRRPLPRPGGRGARSGCGFGS